MGDAGGGGAEAAPCAPREVGGSTTTRAYGADLGLVLVYDARGVLLEERRFASRGAPGPAPAAVPTS